MTQPRFAPIELEDEVRPILRLKAPDPWQAHRPGEFQKSDGVATRGRGVPGPDQGYALGLAARLKDRLVLAPGEHEDDVLIGAVAIALRRASLYGRAPVLSDIELALSLFGFLSEEPPEALVAFRRSLLAGVGHDSWRNREVAEVVTESALRLKPEAARASLSDWRSFFAPTL